MTHAGVQPESLALLFRSGVRLCALPVAHVSETMRPLPIEPLASVPPCVRGLSIIRGAPTPVIDLAVLLADVPTERPARFVTLKIGKRQAALAVDEVIGIRRLPPESLQQLPPLLQNASAGAVSAIGTLDAELLVVLSAARLIPNSVWQAMDTGSASQ